ncbi:helix-turn-helix domain-containing protein [Chitinophaga sp. 30R24]|uniref:helix-turn-helix domain-containing protein n=1 Tax=Chitinophaga sp. 30R24 TaxID=3248838 RepID=UPI003B910A93
MARNKKTRRKRPFEQHTDLEDFLIVLGIHIKTTRKKNGFSSYETFAHDIELSRAAMARYEKGLSDMRISSLLKITDGMGLTLKEFFTTFDQSTVKKTK